MEAKELRVGNAVMLRHADKDYVGTVDDVSLYGQCWERFSFEGSNIK